MRALATLLTDGADDEVVALRHGAAIPRGQLRQQAASLAAWLAARPEQRWALCIEDGYLFALALLACGHAGKQVILPGHSRAAALAELGSELEAVLSDTLARGALTLPLFALEPLLADLPEVPLLPWPCPLCLTLYTSGSTGQPKAVSKSERQLEAELAVQWSLWQPQLAGSLICATVSPQHIYGLLFRVLLPLWGKIPLLAATLRYPEQLTALQSNAWVLISSPAFLCRLDPALGGRGCRLIVSSGGPLAAEASELARRLYGVTPVEIYGSSETGGIALRQQQGEGPHPWRALPGVRLAEGEDHCLQICSPFLPDDTPWQSADRVTLVPGGFLLLGRQDRVVKLAEKRISLDEIERHLGAHPWIREAATLVLQAARRDEVCAALVLTHDGMAHWQRLGAGPFLVALRHDLRPHIESVALPRRLRVVAQLPLSAQGKRLQGEIRELFEPTQQMPLQLPPLLAVTGEALSRQLELELVPELVWFQGHFPGMPVLAGVSQIHMVMLLARGFWSLPAGFSAIEMLKFQQPLRPGQRVTLELRWEVARRRLHFQFLLAGAPASSGRLQL